MQLAIIFSFWLFFVFYFLFKSPSNLPVCNERGDLISYCVQTPVSKAWLATWCDQFFCEYDHSKGRYISKAHMWSYFGAGYPHQVVVSTTISHTIWRCLRAAAVSSGYIQPCVRTCISDKGGSNWCFHEGLGENGICDPSVFNLPSNIIIKWQPRRLLPLPTNGTCLCVPINLLHHQNCGGYG